MNRLLSPSVAAPAAVLASAPAEACVAPPAPASAAWGRCALHVLRATGNARLVEAIQTYAEHDLPRTPDQTLIFARADHAQSYC